MELIAVIMAAENSEIRFQDAVTLLNYGFGKCQLYEDSEMPRLEDAEVKGGVRESVPLEYSGTFSYLDTSGANLNQIEKKVEMKEDISAPLKKGDAVGRIVYTPRKKPSLVAWTSLPQRMWIRRVLRIISRRREMHGVCKKNLLSQAGKIDYNRKSTAENKRRNKMDYAKMIDHTLLKPGASKEQIRKLCREAEKYGFHSVCVNSSYVYFCAQLLKDTDVKVCTVIGFPLGLLRQRQKLRRQELLSMTGQRNLTW